MSLDIRHMRHVIALDEHGSFARAATALGLSQSALSRSIQSVERTTGSSLFVRTATGVEPTDGGHVFIARIRQIAQLIDDLDRDVMGERGLQSGHLHIGGGPYPAQSMLADALARFVADYPRIVVRVMMRDWDELLRRLRAREIEFFVAEFSTFAGDLDLDFEPLAPHPTFIIARRGHPLAGRGPLGIADGFAYPYASLTRIPPRSLEPIRLAQRRSPDATAGYRVFPALEFNALDAVRKIVLGSDALMVAPLACVADELDGGRLVVLGAEPYLAVRYAIVKLKGQPLTQPACVSASTCAKRNASSRNRNRCCSSAGDHDLRRSPRPARPRTPRRARDGDQRPASEVARQPGYLTTLKRARRLSAGDVGFGPGSSPPGVSGEVALPDAATAPALDVVVGENHALPGFARVDREHGVNRHAHRHADAAEASTERHLLVAEAQVRRGAPAHVQHDLAVLHVRSRHLDVAGIGVDDEMRRAEAVRDPLMDGPQQVRTARLHGRTRLVWRRRRTAG